MRKERKAGRYQAAKSVGEGRLEARDMEIGEAKGTNTERPRSVLLDLTQSRVHHLPQSPPSLL